MTALFKEATDSELLQLYSKHLAARDDAGFFSTAGKLNGEIVRMIGAEMTRRGRQADLLAESILFHVRHMSPEDLRYLAGILTAETMPGGCMSEEYDYDDDGDPCDPRTDPFDSFVLLLMAAADDREKERR